MCSSLLLSRLVNQFPSPEDGMDEELPDSSDINKHNCKHVCMAGILRQPCSASDANEGMKKHFLKGKEFDP